MKMGTLGDIKPPRGSNNLRSRDVHMAKTDSAAEPYVIQYHGGERTQESC